VLMESEQYAGVVVTRLASDAKPVQPRNGSTAPIATNTPPHA
jgi:hypothetical protein